MLIDGGQGQLTAAQETLAALGITDVPLVAIAKGPDRDAGRETFFMAGTSPFKLPPRDPLLYFIERLRDEAHRFAIGSHRARRKKDIREAGLQEIPGIGPTRKRALLRHFGTVKAIERASLPDLARCRELMRRRRERYMSSSTSRRARKPRMGHARYDHSASGRRHAGGRQRETPTRTSKTSAACARSSSSLVEAPARFCA